MAATRALGSSEASWSISDIDMKTRCRGYVVAVKARRPWSENASRPPRTGHAYMLSPFSTTDEWHSKKMTNSHRSQATAECNALPINIVAAQLLKKAGVWPNPTEMHVLALMRWAAVTDRVEHEEFDLGVVIERAVRTWGPAATLEALGPVTISPTDDPADAAATLLTELWPTGIILRTPD